MASFVLTTALEIVAVVLLILGAIYQKKLVAFEDKLFRAIKIHAKNYRKRKAYELSVKQREAQSRAPADLPETAAVVGVYRAKKKSGRVA